MGLGGILFQRELPNSLRWSSESGVKMAHPHAVCTSTKRIIHIANTWRMSVVESSDHDGELSTEKLEQFASTPGAAVRSLPSSPDGQCLRRLAYFANRRTSPNVAEVCVMGDRLTRSVKHVGQIASCLAAAGTSKLARISMTLC